MQNSDKNFANGFILTRRAGAPEFVIGNVGINVKDFTAWLNANKDEKGWVNIDLKQSQNGKFYAEQNTWKPSNDAPVAAKNNSEADDDDLPF